MYAKSCLVTTLLITGHLGITPEETAQFIAGFFMGTVHEDKLNDILDCIDDTSAIGVALDDAFKDIMKGDLDDILMGVLEIV